MRALLLVVVAGAVGCGGKSDPCSNVKGTCITATLTSQQVSRVDELDFVASGAVSGPQTSASSAQSLPIAVAIVLPATASGPLTLDVIGKLAGNVVGQGSGSTTVTPGQHGEVTINLEGAGGGEDMAMGGDGGDDMGSGQDLSTVATVRLVAPLSTSTVTKQTPTLHWTLSAGYGKPVVDLCKDRGCTNPQTATAQIATNGLSAVPSAALSPGWVFWRVRLVDGAGATISTSPTWQFWVNKLGGAAVDSSSGTVLDVNGDGVADYLVGARDGSAAHVFLGNTTGTAMTRLDLAAPNGAGFFGCGVASAGDVNGDGFGDFIVGAYTSPNGGTAHLYFGSASPSTVDWNGASAAKRVDLANPIGGNAFGFSVSAAGDVNGDGYADFLVGTPFAGTGGAAWVYLGEAQPAAAHWNGTTAAGRIDLANVDTNGQFGVAVAAAGDVNGDGFGDFLVGNVSTGSGVGAAHLYLGTAMPTATAWNGTSGGRLDISSPDGANGQFGSVGAAGDVNGDGYSDFLIGSGGAALATHVYLGLALPSGGTWNGQRLDVTNPDGAGSTFGASGGFAGDVNGDGYDDFVVGAVGANSSGGELNLFFGEATPNATHWNGTTPTKRIDVPGPDGANANCGASANGAGDINGDGFSDFLLGCPAATGGGGAHAYLGSTTPTAAGFAGSAKINIANPDGAGALFGGSVGPSRTGS